MGKSFIFMLNNRGLLCGRTHMPVEEISYRFYGAIMKICYFDWRMSTKDGFHECWLACYFLCDFLLFKFLILLSPCCSSWAKNVMISILHLTICWGGIFVKKWTSIWHPQVKRLKELVSYNGTCQTLLASLVGVWLNILFWYYLSMLGIFLSINLVAFF